MEAADPQRPSVAVALDVDLERRPDALLAVAMLNGLSAQSQATRASLSISRPSLATARLADVLAQFYSTLPPRAGPATIGMPEGSLPAPDAPELAALLARQNADGTPVYPSSVRRVVDTAESAVLTRNRLLAEPDGSAAIVLAGPATGLSRLLQLQGSRPQLLAKVRHLLWAAGAFQHGRVEPSIASDVAAARQLLAQWPTPLVMVGAEVGEAAPLSAAALEQALAWSAVHPVRDALRAASRAPSAVPTAALAALLYAAQPDSGHFQLSAPGTISVSDDGRTSFVPGPSGRHRHLSADGAQRDRLLALYLSLIAAPPAPPGRKR